jgi:asparagine synthase (glutamine-hydrolysing)
MCGICGKINFDPDHTPERALIERMCAALRHRGPDDSGVHSAGRAALGHCRLSIIDLSAAGHQPMCNEDGSVWVVHNGEVYNFPELRAELQAKGHRFSSNTDTEVIIHLYEDMGPACVERLRGMFAFAVWDGRTQELFCARDRVGKKPLVYAETGEGFVFASEINALVQDPAISRDINFEALHHYLTYQYVPGPQTIFKQIKKLPPAHTLTVKNGRVSIRRYWELSYEPKTDAADESELIERFSAVFQEAVRIRLRSDVPLGAFLSGGLDSSAIVAQMSALMDRPVKTFAIGFEDQDFNELPYARQVADLFDCEHTEYIVKPDALHVLPDIIRHYGEPYADPSCVPTWYVAELTRRHVTVALNGDGGDESFAGYERYYANLMAARVPAMLCAPLHALAPFVPHRQARWSLLRRARRFLGGLHADPAQRYIGWLCYFTEEMKQDLYDPAFAQVLGACDSVKLMAEALQRCRASTLLDQTLSADVAMYLPYDLLVKVDIACMAHALEARSPFLDHELMEFAARLPVNMKLRGAVSKYCLKKAFEKKLPSAILHRKKMGFGVPLQRWFREELRQPVHDVLLNSRTLSRGYFQRTAVEKLLHEHMQGSADHSYRLWALFYLELWHRVVIDESDVLGI